MKHLFTSLFLSCWVSLFSFFLSFQGDGGLPKTYKETLITKDIHEPGEYIGIMPAQDHKAWAKSSVYIKKKGK